ncbi:MAG: thiamine phosphate synthase, partial [Hyphomicrobiaceae bacterium]
VMDDVALYLVLETGEAAQARLAAVLALAEWSAVLIEPAEGTNLDARSAQPLVELAQSRSVAALLSADARLALALGADGVHVPWSQDVLGSYEKARALLGRRFIVGADAGSTRHDAIGLGEAGADYIAFGRDREDAYGQRLDLVAWWAEVCEPPCVALDAATAEEAISLAEAGADFVGVRIARTLPLDRACAQVEDIGGALGLQIGGTTR